LVGSALSHRLCADGYSVIICDSFGSIEDRKWAHLPPRVSDLWRPESLLPALDKSWRDLAGVIVMADGNNVADNADTLFETSFHLPRSIWDFCVVKQRPIYWASSTQVYGEGTPNLSRDPELVARLQPVTALGRAKQAFDMFSAQQAAGPQSPPIATGLRLSHIYGPNEAHKGINASLPYQFLRAAQQSTSVSLGATLPTYQYDFVHADDAATVIAAHIASQQSGFFDIASGETCNLSSLIEMATQTTQKDIASLCDWYPGEPAHNCDVVPTLELEQSSAGKTYRSLKQGMRDLWQMM
jgi:nucleoside-diphosphate-sugar epimerase